MAISCSGAVRDRAFATVLDISGRVRRRLKLESNASSVLRARWDLRDGVGLPVPSGIYLVRIEHAVAPPVFGRIVVLR